MLGRNFLKEKLDAGKTVLGTWCVLPSPIVSDVIASSGLDFLIIDYEHGPIGFETAQAMVIACESRGVSPVMRVGGVLPDEILRAMDIGVHCVQVPNVIAFDQLREIVKAAKYPPAGNKGFSPFTRGGGYDTANSQAIMAGAKNDLLAIHIEGRDAVENIDALLKVKEIDIIFIGMYDLSKSLGIPGQVDSPLLLDSVREMTAKILAAGKTPGTIATSEAQLERFVEMGMRYITYAADCGVLLWAYKAIHNKFEGYKNRYVR